MNRFRFCTLALALILAARIAAPALADGFIVIHDAPQVTHRFPIPPHYPFAPLEVKYHHVTARITDQVAVTEVDESFYNPNNQRLEGTYLFPIPIGAQIDKFTMDINGKPVQAELLDAEKARQIYEDIVRKARDPALLEYAGQGLFKVRIFPIEPTSEKRIQLKYTQLLRNDSGMIQYVYPLNTEKFSAAPLKSVSVKVEINSPRPIRSLYSPSHAVEIKRHGDNHAVVGFEARDIKPDTDFQLFWAADQAGDVGLSLLTYNDGGDSEGGYFMLLASPTQRLSGEKIVAKDVIFVLDTSGSMADNNKIDQAQKALRFCLKNLNDADRFDIIRFSTETQPLFDKLTPVSPATVNQADEFVRSLKPTGGTAIEDALVKAAESARKNGETGRPCFIVFLTDGQPTVGTTDEDQITASVSKVLGDRSVRVFCFGIGTDVNTHLLDKIAAKTHAASQYVLPNENIEVKVSSFFAKISQPVLANPKIRVGNGIRLAKSYPADLPDLFKGEQLSVFGRYSGHGNTSLTLEGTVNGQTRSFTFDAKLADRSTEHGFIPQLWATRRVGGLLEEIRLHGDNRELRSEVTQLARKYGIVTPYTAYLIMEDEGGRGIPMARRSLQSFENDGRVRARMGAIYKQSNDSKDGESAIADARAQKTLMAAASPASQAQANQQALLRGLGYTESQPVQQAIQAQQVRTVNGHTFYQNGTQWIDALAQARTNAKRVQIKFNSDDYFALLKKHPEAAQWLSVGQNVQLLLGDTAYEITD